MAHNKTHARAQFFIVTSGAATASLLFFLWWLCCPHTPDCWVELLVFLVVLGITIGGMLYVAHTHWSAIEVLLGFVPRGTIMVVVLLELGLLAISIAFLWVATPHEAISSDSELVEEAPKASLTADNTYEDISKGEFVIDLLDEVGGNTSEHSQAGQKSVIGPVRNAEGTNISHRQSNTKDWIHSRVENIRRIPAGPGTVFAALLALVTICGFIITLIRLQEIGGLYRGYDVLLHQVYRLIMAELKKVQEDDNALGEIKIMANAPTFGNLSARRSFPRVLHILDEALHHPRISVQILCLDWTVRTKDGVYHWVFPSDDLGTNGNRFPAPSQTAQMEAFEIIGTSMATFYKRLASYLKKQNTEVVAYRQALAILQWVHEVTGDHVVRNTFSARTVAERATDIPVHFVLTSSGGIVFNTLNLPRRTDEPHPEDDRSIGILAWQTTLPGLKETLEHVFAHHTHPERAVNIDPNGRDRATLVQA